MPRAYVGCQVLESHESFQAVVTGKGPLTCASPCMNFECGRHTKRFQTLLTFEQLDSPVVSDVSLEAQCIKQGFKAQVENMSLPPRVSEEVSFKIGLSSKRSATFCAIVRLISSMHFHVGNQSCALIKSRCTEFTLMRFVSRVRDDVTFQSPRTGEPSRTMRTREGFVV